MTATHLGHGTNVQERGPGEAAACVHGLKRLWWINPVVFI